VNWICRKVVDRLNLDMKSGPSFRSKTSDGHEIKSVHLVEITWGIEGLSTTHRTEFRVAPRDACFDVLFGRDVLNLCFPTVANAMRVMASKRISVSTSRLR
jgi:hypothetical protein